MSKHPNRMSLVKYDPDRIEQRRGQLAKRAGWRVTKDGAIIGYYSDRSIAVRCAAVVGGQIEPTDKEGT